MGELNLLRPLFQGCYLCLLYTDDIMIFLQVEKQQIRSLKMILFPFQRLSSLHVNMQKSELLVTTNQYMKAQDLSNILNKVLMFFFLFFFLLRKSGVYQLFH
jgi:hypothetical protein